MMKRVLVTGGCGFIGSAFVNDISTDGEAHVVVLDTLNYCASIHNVCSRENVTFVHGNIGDMQLVSDILSDHRIDTVVHFAAQSHVDHSFENSLQYTVDNVHGTHVLLEASRKYGKLQLFLHISTDEVYGDIFPDEKKTETAILCPTNPYAATKAAAELIVQSYFHSYKLPVMITRGNNVYGPRQYRDKLIPKFITKLLAGQQCTIHGEGRALRAFVYVDDVVDALKLIVEYGVIGNIYNIGSDDELSVMEVTRCLADILCPNVPFERVIEYVSDRPYNDTRYHVCDKKLKDMGWKQKTSFAQGIVKTIDWYKSCPNDYWPH